MHVHSVSKQFFYGEDKKVKVKVKNLFVLGVINFFYFGVSDAKAFQLKFFSGNLSCAQKVDCNLEVSRSTSSSGEEVWKVGFSTQDSSGALKEVSVSRSPDGLRVGSTMVQQRGDGSPPDLVEVYNSRNSHIFSVNSHKPEDRVTLEKIEACAQKLNLGLVYMLRVNAKGSGPTEVHCLAQKP